MKKLYLSLLLLFFVFSLVSCKETTETSTSDLTYDIRADLSEQTITAEETVSFTNVYSDILTEAVFHLYPNCYKETAENKAYTALRSYGEITVSSVSQNGSPCDFFISDTEEYLTVPLQNLQRNEKVSFDFVYSLRLPSGKMRLGYDDGVYNITGFYPQLAVFEDGSFRKDRFCTVGDPIFSETATYRLTFSCPSDLVVAASLPCSDRSVSAEKSVYTYAGTDIRDFALSACADYNVLSAKSGNTDIFYFYRTDEQAQERLNTVLSCYETFSKNFGSPNQASYSVVLVPYEYAGMEYSGLVFISEYCYDQTVDTLLHETAHQWFYHTVGSDGINEGALDEGLASFCAAYYYHLIGDEKTFSDKISAVTKTYTQYETLQTRRKTGSALSLRQSIYEYNNYQYTVLMYHKACLMFNALYELYGDKFTLCLSEYVQEYRGKIASFDDFCAVCNKQLRTDIGGLTNGWMGNHTVATTFSAS